MMKALLSLLSFPALLGSAFAAPVDLGVPLILRPNGTAPALDVHYEYDAYNGYVASYVTTLNPADVATLPKTIYQNFYDRAHGTYLDDWRPVGSDRLIADDLTILRYDVLPRLLPNQAAFVVVFSEKGDRAARPIFSLDLGSACRSMPDLFYDQTMEREGCTVRTVDLPNYVDECHEIAAGLFSQVKDNLESCADSIKDYAALGCGKFICPQ